MSADEFELEVEKRFLEKDYYVIKSAGSRGACDIIAIPLKESDDQRPVCIQCKSGKQPRLTVKELENLRKLAKRYNMRFMLAVKQFINNKWITKFMEL